MAKRSVKNVLEEQLFNILGWILWGFGFGGSEASSLVGMGTRALRNIISNYEFCVVNHEDH